MPKTRLQLFQQSVIQCTDQIHDTVCPTARGLRTHVHERSWDGMVCNYIIILHKNSMIMRERLTKDLLTQKIDEFYRPYEIQRVSHRHPTGTSTRTMRNEFSNLDAYVKRKTHRPDNGISEDHEIFHIHLEVLYHNRRPYPYPCERREAIVSAPAPALGPAHAPVPPLAHVVLAQLESYISKEQYLNTMVAVEIVKTHNKMLETKNSRMKQFIRQLYETQKEWKPCPVCYEEILPEKLVLYDCCHIVCATCDTTCRERNHMTCPECRATI
jgi:hypothetical protein